MDLWIAGTSSEGVKVSCNSQKKVIRENVSYFVLLDYDVFLSSAFYHNVISVSARF